jgi:hypothetical protein
VQVKFERIGGSVFVNWIMWIPFCALGSGVGRGFLLYLLCSFDRRVHVVFYFTRQISSLILRQLGICTRGHDISAILKFPYLYPFALIYYVCGGMCT